MDITIEVFPSGPLQTNAYVVACPETAIAAVIDPAPSSSGEIIDFVAEKGLNLEKILLTHSHWDHIADVPAIKRHFNAPVYIHPLDAPNLMKPGSDKLGFKGVEGVHPDCLIQEGELIDVGTLSFKVIHTPGHTPGGVCYFEPKHNILFSGDTLFKGTIGNLSFPTCEPDKMWDSLKKLEHLPPATKVYPGHGPSTTIGRESWLPNAKEHFS